MKIKIRPYNNEVNHVKLGPSKALIESLKELVEFYATSEKFEEKNNAIEIAAVIWVERESQKGIVVGKNGNVLKKIGSSARIDLANYFEKKVHLKLWVKVKENWADSERDLRSMGFEI